MQLSLKARKAVATGLAVSTLLWAGLAGVAPMVASAALHTDGCLVLTTNNGTVWLVTNGTRRGFTSADVFMSHGFNFSQVVIASAEDANLPVGLVMLYANGTLIKGPSDPLVYLVDNSQRRPFVSGSVFTDLGFSFSSIHEAPFNTFADLPVGANITASTSSGSIPHAGPGPQTVSCSTTTTPPSGSGDEGELKNFDSVSADENGFSEDEDSVELYAWEMEADGSDMNVTRVDVYMGQTTTAESNNADDYFDSATLLVDGDEVATLDVSDWDEDDWDQTADVDNDEFRLRFDTDFTVNDGDTATMTVEFNTANNIDTGDSDNATWEIDLATDSIRATDEAGFSDEYGESNEATVTVDEVDTGTLDVSLNSDNPDAQAVEVDDTNDTNGVEVLAFDLEANDGDILIDDLTVTVDDVGTLTDVNAVVNTLHLFRNGDEIASKSVPASSGVTEPVTFDIDENSTDEGMIEDGDTAEFTVEADINNLDGGDFDAGDGILVSFTSVTAEDDAGDNVEADGTAVGENFSFFVDGISAELVSTSAVATPSGVATVDDTGTFTIVFDVTAFGSDAFLDASPITDETGIIAAGAAGYQNIDASTTSVASGVIECASCDDTANTTLRVAEGTTERFTVTIAGSGADVFASASLTSIMYALTAIDGDTLYTSNMTDFQTSSVWLDSN